MFSAVAEQMGVDSQMAVKLSAGFGGGMMLGRVCGAVTGGIMASGLKSGGLGMQSGIQTGKLVRQFADRFKAQHHSINCPELTGGFDTGKVDLNDPAALAAAYKTALEKTQFAVCPGLVKDATTIVAQILSDPQK